MRTPQHTTGPFFPAALLGPDGNDLTGGTACEGERIEVAGVVVDGRGAAAVNVILELWQADARGIFHDPADPRYDGRDRGFRGFGRAATDAQGRYRFVTVMPGSYPGDDTTGWIRPPHLRFTVIGSGVMRPLVAEVFFAGHPLNESDRVWAAIPPERRDLVIARPASGAEDRGCWRFDLVLQGERETPFFEDHGA